MDQKQRREYLINELIKENPEYRNMEISDDVVYQKRLLRSLMNVRKAGPISEEFERIQDEYCSDIKVIFNVFKDEDREIYERLLG